VQGNSKFKFVLTNPTANPVTFLKWNTPMEFDAITSPIFAVQQKGIDGEETVSIPYNGRMTSRALPMNLEEAASEFITIQSGETIFAEVDVSKGYQLEANTTYEISVDSFLNFFEGSFADLVEKNTQA